MVVVGCARKFRSIFIRLCEEAGDFDDGSRGGDAGVGVEGPRWLLGGASVGESAVILVGSLVGRSLGRERRQDVGRFFVGDSLGQTALGRRSGYWLESLGRERRRDVGRALVGDSVGRMAS